MTGEKKKGGSENLKICVRIRPLKAEEAARKNGRILQNIDNTMIVLYDQVATKLDALRENRKKEQRFAYDSVFGENSTQASVYNETTRNLISHVTQGYNATVFAYGPTGTGKTFTMVGTEQQPGIMVMALNDLFTAMKKGSQKFTVFMSYLEIYNEHIRDLLVPNSKTLELREDPKSGVIQVTELTQISTTSTTEVMKMLQKGNQRRSCESTAANQTSSRSHALLQIIIRLSSHDQSVGEQIMTSRLIMVDLAGSERAKNTQNVGKRLQEGAHINKSLLALGNVINALAEGGTKYVNFRDSKLTRLLKDALTGNCKTVMIAHVSPATAHREESKNTLIYADKAKKISTKTRQNKVDVSYHISQYQTIISELKEEIRRLKSKLGEDGNRYIPVAGKVNKGNAKTMKASDDKIEKMKLELIEAFNEQMKLRNKLVDIDNSMLALSIEFEKQTQVITDYEAGIAAKKARRKGSISVDPNDTDEDDDDRDDEPEEITDAWDDLEYIQNEQKRYAGMKEMVQDELEESRKKSKEIEENLPSTTTNYEQRELLALLCKVHELEIQHVEMKSSAILKERDLYQREVLISRYDRQCSLVDKIIKMQKKMIAESKQPTPYELQELYTMYQMEVEYTNNLKKSKSTSDLNSRSSSVMSSRYDKLPPIGNSKEPEKLFKPGRRHSIGGEERGPSTPLTISPISKSARNSALPSLNVRQRSNSHVSSVSFGSKNPSRSRSNSISSSSSTDSRPSSVRLSTRQGLMSSFPFIGNNKSARNDKTQPRKGSKDSLPRI